jgi:hypothetical protein
MALEPCRLSFCKALILVGTEQKCKAIEKATLLKSFIQMKAVWILCTVRDTEKLSDGRRLWQIAHSAYATATFRTDNRVGKRYGVDSV